MNTLETPGTVRAPSEERMGSIPLQTCPRCFAPMSAIKGSRLAVCRRCGYKDDCC